MTVEDVFKRRIKVAEDALEYVKGKTKKESDEYLIVKRDRKRTKYYAHKHGENVEKYLGSDKIDLIRELQEKDYCIKLERTAEAEIVSCNKILSLLKKTKKCEQVFLEIPEEKRTMIEPFVFSGTTEIKKKIKKECRRWDNEKQFIKDVDRNLQLVTQNGERVRSKSELIIADRLKASGVPYYYEGRYLFVDEKTDTYQEWFPDFQILNTRTGETLYWEHFGLMDNPEYCASCQYKLETYAKHGIIMGKNLIITMESSQHALNVSYVEKLIEEFLK